MRVHPWPVSGSRRSGKRIIGARRPSAGIPERERVIIPASLNTSISSSDPTKIKIAHLTNSILVEWHSCSSPFSRSQCMASCCCWTTVLSRAAGNVPLPGNWPSPKAKETADTAPHSSNRFRLPRSILGPIDLAHEASGVLRTTVSSSLTVKPPGQV